MVGVVTLVAVPMYSVSVAALVLSYMYFQSPSVNSVFTCAHAVAVVSIMRTSVAAARTNKFLVLVSVFIFFNVNKVIQ